MFGLNKKKQINLEPPKGWYVQQAFQNPMHMLWDVVLVSFDDVVNNIEKPRHYISTEKDTYQQALQDCIDNCVKG
jgi:hypothetical protein